MPLYDFKCQECGKTKEVSLLMNVDRKKNGPKCKCTGKEISMERMFTPPSVIINGRNITIGDLVKRRNRKKYGSKK